MAASEARATKGLWLESEGTPVWEGGPGEACELGRPGVQIPALVLETPHLSKHSTFSTQRLTPASPSQRTEAAVSSHLALNPCGSLFYRNLVQLWWGPETPGEARTGSQSSSERSQDPAQAWRGRKCAQKRAWFQLSPDPASPRSLQVTKVSLRL